MKRLFTALALPREVGDSVAALCTGLPGARWSNPDQLHITLRFLGDLEDERLDELVDALAQIEHQPFALSLRGVGQFLNGRSPHTLWVGVDGGEPLLSLRRKIEKTALGFGIEPERQRFSPHLSIAKLRNVDRARLEDYLSLFGDYSNDGFNASEFTLFSSVLRPDGARHTFEADFPLREADAAFWKETS